MGFAGGRFYTLRVVIQDKILCQYQFRHVMAGFPGIIRLFEGTSYNRYVNQQAIVLLFPSLIFVQQLVGHMLAYSQGTCLEFTSRVVANHPIFHQIGVGNNGWVGAGVKLQGCDGD